MLIRSTVHAAAFTLVSLGAAHANGLRPIEGRSVLLSTPNQAGALEICRSGDSLLVRKANAFSN